MTKYKWFNLGFHLPQPVKKTIPFLLFFAAISINIYFRLFPAYFPQLKQQAKISVENKVMKDIVRKVEDTYPDFNLLIKKKIILQIFEEDKKTKSGFKKEIQEEYNKLKDPYQNEYGQTYILEVDGYQWMRYVENILKNGHPGDRLKDRCSYDDYMSAPSGCAIMPDRLFFYLSAFLYRLTTFFLKDIPLASFLFFLPLFYSFLFLTILYLVVRSFFSDIAAFFSVIFVGLNKVVLNRTCCGWFDYDSLTFALPLVIVWLISLSFRNRYTIQKRLFYSVFSAFMVTIYSGIWIGYWWIFIICAAYYLYAITNTYSLNKKAHKEILTQICSAAVFFVSSLALCSFVFRGNAFRDIFFILEKILPLGASQQTSIWPYTFYTVGELAKINPEQIVRNLGGSIIPIFAMIGALWVYIKERRTERKDFVALMVFWLFMMCFAATKGFRFIVFLVIPLGVFFGAFIEDIFKLIRYKLNKKPIIFSLSLIVFFAFILWSGKTMINSARAEASSIYPIINDSWYKALVYIDKNTPKNSIINAWWDYGNFFKTISKRRVIFDPQSQYTNLAYWMSQVILARDENKAMNILRMLDNSSNTLFDEMQKEIKDDFQCAALLKKILGSNETEAKKILAGQNISEELKGKIMENIFFKEPAPAYFFIDKSMIYKMYNISFLGNWDFSKLYVIRNRNLSKEETIENVMKMFSLSKPKAESIYTEVILSVSQDESSEVLSRRYSFPFLIDEGREDGNSVYFDNGIILNLFDHTARTLSLDRGYRKFKDVFIYDNNKLIAYEYKDTDYDAGAIFLKGKNGWQSAGLSRELAHSLFVKLYFLNGAGSKYFEPFYADDDAGIYIYRINWQKRNQEIGK